MGMTILTVGVVLCWAAHQWKSAAPGQRAVFGDKDRVLVIAALVLSVLLMIWGYRTAEGPVWWGPTPAMTGINNLLVLIAIYLFAASGMKTRIGTRLRNPQLLGFSLWAVAHLLVNGDLASLVLFGGFLVWALVQMAMTPRTPRQAAPVAPLRKEIMAIAGAIIVFGVIGLIHAWIGPNPFGA